MQEHTGFTTIVQKIQNLESKEQEESLGMVFERLQPKIQQALFQTSPDRRDDLEQEIYIKLMDITRNYQWKDSPKIDRFTHKIVLTVKGLVIFKDKLHIF